METSSIAILMWVMCICIFFALIVIGWSLTKTVRNKQKQTKNFKFYFGIDYPADYKVRNLTLGYVELILKSFVSSLDIKCRAEEEMLKNSETDRMKIGVEKQLLEFAKVQNELKQAKLNFWGARAAAKYFGYKVKAEYKEYLEKNSEISGLPVGSRK